MDNRTAFCQYINFCSGLLCSHRYMWNICVECVLVNRTFRIGIHGLGPIWLLATRIYILKHIYNLQKQFHSYTLCVHCCVERRRTYRERNSHFNSRPTTHTKRVDHTSFSSFFKNNILRRREHLFIIIPHI